MLSITNCGLLLHIVRICSAFVSHTMLMSSLADVRGLQETTNNYQPSGIKWHRLACLQVPRYSSCQRTTWASGLDRKRLEGLTLIPQHAGRSLV